MSRKDQPLNLSNLKIQAHTHKRTMITPTPRSGMYASAPAERKKVIEGVKKIIEKHMDVLVALKDR
jgi:hypothetical protein